MSVFKLVQEVEVASPEYIDCETGDVLVKKNPRAGTVVNLQIVEYDEKKREIVDWLECFMPFEKDKAKKALAYYRRLELEEL